MKVRADKFRIARAVAQCSACGASTEVIALVLPPGHETDESDELEGIGDAELVTEQVRWVSTDERAFLFFVEHMSQPALDRVSGVTTHYRLVRIEGEMEESGFRNQCAQCSSVVDDQELFCEPGGAFSPVSASEARKVSLIPVDEAIEATAGGYAYEPEFFEAMLKM